MRITASKEDMVKFKPEDASLTEANMRAVLKQFKVSPSPCEFNEANKDDVTKDYIDDGGEDDDEDDDDATGR